MEAVAAGEGALRTWTEFLPSAIRKSSTSAPSFLTAWALTPAEMGTTSSSSTSGTRDRKSTRLNSSHANISYAVFCLKKKKQKRKMHTSKTINRKQYISSRITH